MTALLDQLAHRRKAVVALLGSIATFVVAVAADTTAGHIAAAVLAVLNGAAVHQTKNAPKPKTKRPVKKA